MRSGIPEDQGQLWGVQLVNPAAGDPVTIFADAGQRWSLDAIGFVFTSSVAVANRQVYMTWWNGALPVCGSLWCTVIQVAGLVRTYQFTKWLTSGLIDTLGNLVLPFNGPSLLDSVNGIRITADNIQAADTFTDIKVRGQRWIDG
jgi:hypothetical protein